MTMPEAYHDDITSSVAGLLTLFIILFGNVLAPAWFYIYFDFKHLTKFRRDRQRGGLSFCADHTAVRWSLMALNGQIDCAR